MRYRARDENGDYTFGQGSANFLVDSPATVAQAIETRLGLWQGQYFLDLSVGVDWQGGVLGYSQNGYDQVIRDVISATPGFASFVSYSSTLNRATRQLTVNATVLTIYATAPVSITAAVPASGYGVGGYANNPYGV